MRFNLLQMSRTLAAAGALLVPGSLFAGEAGYTYVGGGAPTYGDAYGYCPECEAGHGHHNGLHNFHHGYHTPFHVWLHHDGSRTASPDHGYRRPTKLPIVNYPVEYYRYWPERWYGMPGSQLPSNPNYPMVYMPTDTTQLGYYYQRVPTWQPNPGMLPNAPYPPAWHRYERLATNGYANGECYIDGSYAEPTIATAQPTLAEPTPIAAPTDPVAPEAPAPEAAPTPDQVENYDTGSTINGPIFNGQIR